MEWILCLCPSIEPHLLLEDLQSTNPKFSQIIKKIDRSNPMIFPFLISYINTITFSSFIRILLEVYLPPSCSEFVTALISFDTTIYQHYIDEYKDLNPKLRFNMQYVQKSQWKEDLKNKSLLIPTNMLKYLDSMKHNRDTEIFEALMYGKNYVPYLDRFLMGKIGDNRMICSLLKPQISDANLYLLLKFLKNWEPLSLNAQECKTVFIQTLPSHTVQILFAPSTCWYDSNLNACENCTSFNWMDYLSQWRCVALCENRRQCFRFSIPNEEFCKFHQIQPIQKKYLKRQYQKQLKHEDVKADEYQKDPNDETIDQPMRFHLTNRPITPMTKIVKKTKPINGYYIPIIRYEDVYYSEDDTKINEQYCGKFFYYEPESNVYLHLGKSGLFASKVDAFLQLSYLAGIRNIKAVKTFITEYGVNPIDANDFLQFSNNGKYRTDILDNIKDMDFIYENTYGCVDRRDTAFWDNFLTYRFRTVFLSIENFNSKWHNKCIPLFYPTDKQKDLFGNGVADFDFLDQDICKLGLKLGFDTIILQHEIGNHDSVTEIIHTNAYKDNLYEINNVKISLKQQTIYPKIWFPKENGLLKFENGKKKQISVRTDVFANEDFFQNFSHDLKLTKQAQVKFPQPKRFKNTYEYESEEESDVDNFG